MKLISRASFVKLAAAIGIGAGSATAIHAVTVTAPPSLPTSQVAPTTTSSTTTTQNPTSAEINHLSNEAAKLQQELDSARSTLASRVAPAAVANANNNAAFLSGNPTTTSSIPPTNATTGASSAKSDDGSSDDSGEHGTTSVSGKDGTTSSAVSVPAKSDD